MSRNKEKIQSLIFNSKYFNKTKIRYWVEKNGFIIDNRLRKPIMKCSNTYRVRQRNPDWFNKKTFIVKSLGIGVKGVYGKIKR